MDDNGDTVRQAEEHRETHRAATAVGAADVKVDRLTKGTEHRWMDYIGKEAHTGSTGNTGVIDYSNTQIPAHLLED